MTDRLSDLLDGDDARRYRHADTEHDDAAGIENGEGGADHDSVAADDNTPFVDDADEELTLPPHRRVTPVTAALLALLLVALAFGAGVLVQKHHDTGLSRTASGGIGAALGGLPGGAPGGGFPSGAVPGGFGGAPGVGASTTSAPPGGGATKSTPVVIGTVVSAAGQSLTVKDLGGTTHLVHLDKHTTITAPIKHTKLTAGAAVSVYGTETSGSVSATNVTIR